jgi:competence protein ComEC
MTKRPLLCGVLVFVLGEIIGMNQSMAMGLGMVVVFLCVWKFVSMRRKTITMPLFFASMLVSLVLGMLNGIRTGIPDSFLDYVEAYTLEDNLQCELTGTILQIEHQEERDVLLVRTDEIYNDSFTTTGRYKIRLYIKNDTIYDSHVLQIGESLHCSLQLTVPEQPANPGEFDSVTYYHARGITFLGYVNDYECLESGGSPVRRSLMYIQTRAQQVFQQTLPEQQAGIMEAMLLGVSGDLDSEIKDLYRRNGIAHILAISALHISILGATLYRLLRKLGLSYPLAGIPVILLLIAYGWMTGFSSSTIRAVMMFSLMLIGDMLGRTYDMLTAAGIACLYMLIEQPVRILDAGFLLSFSAVLTLGLLSPAVEELLPWDSRWKNSLVSGIMIQIITAPIIIHFYYEFPVYGFLLNFIVIPLMTPLIICGMLGLFLYPCLPSAGAAVIQPCGWILMLYQWLCEHVEQLPGAVLHIGVMAWWEILLYYVVLVGIYMLWKYRRRSMILIWLALYIGILLLTSPHQLQITMLDVGQGDSILLQTPDGQMILLDGGSSTRSSIGTYVITPAVKYYGSNQLDYVFVSHMDSDHVNGIEELIERSMNHGLQIKRLVLPKTADGDAEFEALIQQAQNAGIAVYIMNQGETIQMGRVVLQCLYPGDTGSEGDSANNNSMVISVSYGSFDMLFTGDLEAIGEQLLMEQQVLGRYNVLKVGHHGSSGASSRIFLEQIQPEIALISCGRKNRYGHPHEETLERLQEQNAEVYCTKEDGAIVLRTDGESLQLNVYRNP